jgi:hypothetical protein
MSWFEQFFPPGAFFPGGPASMPNVFPITLQNTLPPRNQQRDEFMYGYGVRPPGVMPDVTGRPYPDLEIQRADSAPNWTSPGMPGIPPGVGPSAPPTRSFMPASNPPPARNVQPSMMPGALPEGTNPPGAMGMGDLGYPGAMTMPASPASPATPERKSFDWGPDNSIWSTLMAGGSAMMQPSWYGLGGQLSQGLQGAAAANDPMKRAQTELLRAQAGKAKGELGNVALGRQIAEQLPNNHPAKFSLMLGDLKGGAEKMGVDPNKMVNWNSETGKMEPNLLYIQAKVAESAAQGAMKYGPIGKDASNNDVFGFPPIPDVRSILGATGIGPQGAAPRQPGQRAEAIPAAPGSPTGPGRPAPLAPGATGQTTGEKQADEVFAKEKIEWQTTGRADVTKSLSQLREVIGQMKAGKVTTGPLFGLTPRGLDAITQPKTTDAMERVQEVAQRNLRLVLGGQFAQQEGEKLISRAFNPYLKPEINADRAARLMTAIEQAAAAKEQMVAHFEKFGTLRGYTGPSMEALKQQVRDAVKDTEPTKAADKPARRDTGKKLNGKPVYFNESTGKYETD